MLIYAGGMTGTFDWDTLTLELGGFCYGRVTAASVMENLPNGLHYGIHVHDVPLVLASIRVNATTLRCHWLNSQKWGKYLYIHCKDMPSSVQLFTGVALHPVGDWIKLHFHNCNPGLSRSVVCCADGMAGTFDWDTLTLELGDCCYGRVTAASVMEQLPNDGHFRIHVHDVPIMLASIRVNATTLRCHWLDSQQWGKYLYIRCKDMASSVELFTGRMMYPVGDWIKLHFHNRTPILLRSGVCKALMMAFHPRLGAESGLNILTEDLLKCIMHEF